MSTVHPSHTFAQTWLVAGLWIRQKSSHLFSFGLVTQFFDQRKPQVDFCLLMKAQSQRQSNKQTILYNKGYMKIKRFLFLIYYKDKQANFG